jgi:hypothetical protein
VLPFKKQFLQKIMFRLVEKTTQIVCHTIFAECHFAIASFDMCMSKGVHGIFSFVWFIFWGLIDNQKYNAWTF